MLAAKFVLLMVRAGARRDAAGAGDGVDGTGPTAGELLQVPAAGAAGGGWLSLDRVFILIDEHIKFSCAVPRGAGLGRAHGGANVDMGCTSSQEVP